MTRRLLAAGALIAALAVVAVLVWQGDALWQAAYPYLPARAQGVPYRVRAALDRSETTPVPLPTVDQASQESPATRLLPESQAAAATLLAATPIAATLPTATLPAATLPAATPIAASPPAATPPAATLPAPTVPRPTDVPNVSGVDLPAEVALRGLRHEHQTWNNCGPATISMALSYFNASDGQAQAARHLKPDPDDKNVSPAEMAGYARDQGYEAVVRINGTRDGMRTLLALGVPVIVETWFVPEPGDEMGHYRVLTGYSDEGRHFVADDSYNGPGITLDYDSFDELWRVFNRAYLVVYPAELSGSVDAAIGSDLDDAAMHAGAVERAQVELGARDASVDAFGWFNLGGGLLALGDAAGAVGAFDQARAIGLPWRMLWYQTEPFEAYAAEGRWDDVVALADANLRNAPNLEESHYWLGRARLARGDAEGARAAWQRALELNPLYGPAAEALQDLG